VHLTQAAPSGPVWVYDDAVDLEVAALQSILDCTGKVWETHVGGHDLNLRPLAFERWQISDNGVFKVPCRLKDTQQKSGAARKPRLHLSWPNQARPATIDQYQAMPQSQKAYSVRSTSQKTPNSVLSRCLLHSRGLADCALADARMLRSYNSTCHPKIFDDGN
jgi:hypothetical protein